MARRDPYRVHRWVDRFVLVGVVGAGLLHPAPFEWLQSFGLTVAVLWAAVFGGAWAVTRWAEARTERIQGPRRKPAKVRQEAKVTAQAMWVMAGLVAWPLTQSRLGVETGFHWDLEGTGWTPLTASLVTIGGVVGIDAWTYWKHRALHTKPLFGFHRDHHAFGDPRPSPASRSVPSRRSGRSYRCSRCSTPRRSTGDRPTWCSWSASSR
jgi:sterol desaturase/sphingolipid hydroxylase (fatty acid hydroxylase superfamily)